ncbi:class I SAM-dependent methyltransferase [Actinomycetospora endophytica]|uniref:Class I SAM-dependent methyltransferase n=1 Tax=Actinomycetospora endophytica TaxID=2291215 RepID=A0ABS8P7W6_9PSEU|nr:class I SAM-dependent methyltransferase [Actinomycetospora endophytica]MCD2194328.1 class I SAM-dependent methyltransferase [Actinomycetospora endophytica]
MTEDGGRRGRGDDGENRRARATLRVVDSTSTPSPSGSRPPAPTDRTTPPPADDAGSPAGAPGLAGRRRGAGRPPGTRAGGAHGSNRIPVYPRVPTGPLRVTATPPGRRSEGHAHGPTRPGPDEEPGPRPLGDPPHDEETGSAVTVALTDPTGEAGTTERLRARSEQFTGDDEVLAAARERATEHGIVPIGPGACAALTFLASATRARSVVEIGSGAGLGTVSLLRGMPREGLLTSIDCEAPHQGLARQACVEAGFAPGRVRMITGRALEVLPRLSDAGYDLVLVDALTVEYPRYLEEAVRLLRPGGVVALDNVLWTGRVNDPVRREAISSALRETVRAVRTDERLAPLLLPVSDGLLCASLLP